MTTINTKTEANYDFGEDFNYNQWSPGTVLTLTNVPWNSDYRDVVRFNTKGALDSYIDNAPNLILNNATMQRLHMNARIPTPYNAALKYNYLRAKNPLGPHGDSSRTYYYFIVDVQYRAFNATELVLQLDVWQTFGYDVHIQRAYIERGHIGIANTNQFDNYGRDYLNVPEGLDTGGEYRVLKVARETVMDVSAGTPNYAVLVASTVDLTVNPGVVTDPILTTASGAIVDGIVSGAAFYVFPSATDFTKFLNWWADKPWATQGIISVTLIPKLSRYHTESLKNVAMIWTPAADWNGGPMPVADWTMYEYPKGLSVSRRTALAPGWRDTLLSHIPAQYRVLKKLLTFPYCVVELTTWTGQALPVRPESWADDDATVREQAVMMPPGQRIAFMPYRYNADPATSPASDDDGGEHLDFATTISGFVNVPVINNMAISWLASNKNGLAFQFASADWSQQRAFAGARATGEVAGSEIRNTSRSAIAGNVANTAQAINTSNTMVQAGFNNYMGGVIGAVASGAGGDPAGGVVRVGQAGAGMLNAGLQASNMLENATVQNTARNTVAQSNMTAAGEIRDTNVGLARFAAKGDYQNAVAGINAKIQDSRMIQPSTSGQFGGDAMNLAHSNVEVSARFKMVDNSVLKIVGNFWLRYGYSIQQFIKIPSDYKCMTRFTYWKMSEAYITQAFIPESFKQTIRGIFEKGVTVWSDPDYIGTTDLEDNHPLDGISY